jgi:hypothetical protein
MSADAAPQVRAFEDAPGLTFAMEIHAACAPAIDGGPGKRGVRRHIPIIGGHFEGPRLRGKILPGGSDWALVLADGSSAVSAHYTLLTDDGVPIYIQNHGIRVSSPAVTARLRAGEAVDWSEYYFRGAPVFDAPLGPYGWLAERLFVAVCRRVGDVTIVRVFAVE